MFFSHGASVRGRAFCTVLALTLLGCDSPAINGYFAPIPTQTTTANVPAAPVTPPAPVPSSPTTTETIRHIQPALAVRGMSCLACHANIQAPVVTDFGYTTASTNNFFMDSYKTGTPSALFGEGYYDPFVWQILDQIEGQVTVPVATVPAEVVSNTISGASSTTTMSLSSYLTSPNAEMTEGFWLTYFTPAYKVPTTLSYTNTVSPGNDASGNALPAVNEENFVYIGAPTVSEILALAPGQPSAGPWVNQIVSGVAKGNISGLSQTTGINGTAYITNSGTVQCSGADVVINGTLLLNNANISANQGGCRLYVTGSVFIEGPIQYVGLNGGAADASSNLQITSATSIIMGVGLSGISYDGGSAAGALDGGEDGNGNPLDTRLIGDSRSPVFRSAPNSNAYSVWANSVMAEANNIGSALLIDASNITHSPQTGTSAAGQTRTAINFSHLLLNAPDIQSRYLGQMSGIIISEIAVFSLGEFSYTYDPVFSSSEVSVLPILPYDILCAGSSGTGCNPAQ